MPNIYVVRAEGGKYAENFVKGGYVAIGWLPRNDLSKVRNRDEIRELYEKDHPDEKGIYKTGQQVGQIARFLLEMTPGDYIITPDLVTEYLHWGILADEPYQYVEGNDGCRFRHRRKVNWKGKIQRSQFSVPFQNCIRATLTVFSVAHKNNFFETIGKKELVEKEESETHKKVSELVLERVLELTAEEFEILVTALLNALGFEAEHTGRVGDDGVDAKGELDLYGVAKINLWVQVKRYKKGDKINARTVKALRQNIPAGGQGAFFTTSDFQDVALKVAIEPGFPRIGTINGEQLVDLLSEKWEDLDLPEDLKQKLGLKKGLVFE